MKYLKRYNESVMNRLDKSSIEEILDIFNDLGDEGFDIINKDLLNNPSVINISFTNRPHAAYIPIGISTI